MGTTGRRFKKGFGIRKGGYFVAESSAREEEHSQVHHGWFFIFHSAFYSLSLISWLAQSFFAIVETSCIYINIYSIRGVVPLFLCCLLVGIF